MQIISQNSILIFPIIIPTIIADCVYSTVRIHCFLTVHGVSALLGTSCWLQYSFNLVANPHDGMEVNIIGCSHSIAWCISWWCQKNYLQMWDWMCTTHCTCSRCLITIITIWVHCGTLKLMAVSYIVVMSWWHRACRHCSAAKMMALTLTSTSLYYVTLSGHGLLASWLTFLRERGMSWQERAETRPSPHTWMIESGSQLIYAILLCVSASA